jgi:hypothetical protein
MLFVACLHADMFIKQSSCMSCIVTFIVILRIALLALVYKIESVFERN